jgi:hypothetical protein
MTREHQIERIISSDGKVELGLGQLMRIYETLEIERFPTKNHHNRNWNSQILQYTPQVQDPIISFTSKSLVLGLNNEQVCKIRVDGNENKEIKNIEFIKNKTDLFPKVDFIVDLPFNMKGIIMERIKVMSKTNFTSGELNRIYYNFKDDLNKLHEYGIIHNDLGRAKNSKIRPNIIISTDRIRLLDFESIKFRSDIHNWIQLLDNEKQEVHNYFDEIIEFACDTLT